MNFQKSMRQFVLAATVTVVSFAGFTNSGMAADTAGKNFIPVEKISAPTRPPGGIGWQKVFAVDVPTGRNLIYTDACPSDATVPVNGSFNPVPAAKPGLQLVANFRSNSMPQQWQWEFDWPRGAPAGTRIYFNIYCTTK